MPCFSFGRVSAVTGLTQQPRLASKLLVTEGLSTIGIVSKKTPSPYILEALEEELRGTERGRDEEFRTISSPR